MILKPPLETRRHAGLVKRSKIADTFQLNYMERRKSTKQGSLKLHVLPTNTVGGVNKQTNLLFLKKMTYIYWHIFGIRSWTFKR